MELRVRYWYNRVLASLCKNRNGRKMMHPRVKYWYDKFIALDLESEAAEFMATMKAFIEGGFNPPKEWLDSLSQSQKDMIKKFGTISENDGKLFFFRNPPKDWTNDIPQKYKDMEKKLGILPENDNESYSLD